MVIVQIITTFTPEDVGGGGLLAPPKFLIHYISKKYPHYNSNLKTLEVNEVKKFLQ